MRHDVGGMIRRFGGTQSFLNILDQYFDGGFHAQDNQPTLLTPWLHTYAGRPDKNVDRVRAAMEKNYRAERKGLPGNDDAGTMSAWDVFAAMGFYPNSGQDVYLLASPTISKITMQLGESGKAFVKAAPGLSETNKYVQSATLNGKVWDKAWFRHSDVVNGANLVLKMGDKPSNWGTKEAPPSLTSATQKM